MDGCLVCVCSFAAPHPPPPISESFIALLFVVKMVGDFEKASERAFTQQIFILSSLCGA